MGEVRAMCYVKPINCVRKQNQEEAEMSDNGHSEETKREITLKPRRHPRLWQSYLWWEEMMKLRQKHLLRLNAITRGASSYAPDFEEARIAAINPVLEEALDMLVADAQAVGPIYGLFTGIKGIGPSLAAKVLAQVDDIASFETISKLWRFAGYGMYEYWVDEKGAVQAPREGYVSMGTQGEREMVRKLTEPKEGWHLETRRDVKIAGWKSPYNTMLKSTVWQCVASFIKQQTPGYVELYYQEKGRWATEHPEPICRTCGVPVSECRAKRSHKVKLYTPAHMHAHAMRKVSKVLLQHLWVVWRITEGLPISRPWIHAVGGHGTYIAPEDFGWAIETRAYQNVVGREPAST